MDTDEHYIKDELAKFSRRLDNIQKTMDLLFADREILENISGRLTALEEQWKLTRQHDNEVRKDIKEEIQSSGEKVALAVETKIEGIQKFVRSRKKNPEESWWKKFWLWKKTGGE